MGNVFAKGSPAQASGQNSLGAATVTTVTTSPSTNAAGRNSPVNPIRTGNNSLRRNAASTPYPPAPPPTPAGSLGGNQPSPTVSQGGRRRLRKSRKSKKSRSNRK